MKLSQAFRLVLPKDIKTADVLSKALKATTRIRYNKGWN